MESHDHILCEPHLVMEGCRRGFDSGRQEIEAVLGIEKDQGGLPGMCQKLEPARFAHPLRVSRLSRVGSFSRKKLYAPE